MSYLVGWSLCLACWKVSASITESLYILLELLSFPTIEIYTQWECNKNEVKLLDGGYLLYSMMCS